MIMVGIVPERFSHHLIKESGCFVVNLAPKSFKKQYGYLGSVSGRDEDKMKNIRTEEGKVVKAPILLDCPVSIECTVVDSIKPGTHELFIGKVEYVHADEEYLDDEGNIKWANIDLL